MADSRWPTLTCALVNQAAALCARMLEKGIGLAPQAELQALLAEYAVERLLDNTAFLLHERVAERCAKPVSYGLRIMSRLLQITPPVLAPWHLPGTIARCL